MALSNIFDLGRKPRIESLPHTPAEQAVSQYQQQVLPQISSALVPQTPVIGRSGAAGLATAPANLRALAEQYFPTTQPTTPEAAVAASLPGVAGPLQRQYEEQALPALQAAFQSMGAGRSGQGVGQAGELYRRQVSDPLAEALSRTAVQQAQFNQAQELERRKAQVGLLAPQDQAVANLAGQTIGIRPPTQTVVPMPAEQPGIGTQLGTAALMSALASGGMGKDSLLGGLINQIGAVGGGAKGGDPDLLAFLKSLGLGGLIKTATGAFGAGEPVGDAEQSPYSRRPSDFTDLDETSRPEFGELPTSPTTAPTAYQLNIPGDDDDYGAVDTSLLDDDDYGAIDTSLLSKDTSTTGFWE